MSTVTNVATTLRRRRGLTKEAAAAAEKEQLTYTGFLAELLLAECDDRDRHSTIRRVNGAGFPRSKFLEDFDYTANPNINPATIHLNQSFSGWTNTFTDPRLCAAIIDRLTFGGNIIEPAPTPTASPTANATTQEVSLEGRAAGRRSAWSALGEQAVHLP